MNTKMQGNIGLGKAIAYFTEHGYTVSIPLNDSQSYDLIVDDGNTLYKVDVKTTTVMVASGSYEVNLIKTGGNQSFHTAKHYDYKNVNYIFIYAFNGDMYLVPTDVINNRSTITVGNKYQEYKL